MSKTVTSITINRRHFLMASSVGIASASAAIAQPAAAYTTLPANPMAGHIYFTGGKPGRYSEKTKSHVPDIKIMPANQGVNIKVTTRHEMKGWEHYILKHQLFDRHLNLLAEHMFNPERDSEPVSEFWLRDYRGPLFVTSICNKHDLWMAQTSV